MTSASQNMARAPDLTDRRMQEFARSNDKLVVKRTFFEVDDICTAEGPGRMQRASSDSALLDSSEKAKRREALCVPDDQENEVEFHMAGLSDLDSDSDTDTTDKEPGFQAAPLPCYSHIEEAETPLGGSVMAENSAADGCSEWSATTVTGRSDVADSAMEQLAAENRRLELENMLLRKQCMDAMGKKDPLQSCGGSNQPVPASTPTQPLAQQQQQQQREQVPPYHSWFIPVGLMMGAQCPQMPMGAPAMPVAACADLPAPLNRKQRGQRRKAAAAPADTSAPPGHRIPIPLDEAACQGRTTVMLQNLPNNYSRAMLLAMLDGEGFSGTYDFLYLPIDFKTRASLGYAFINFVRSTVVPKFWRTFEGFTGWIFASKKVCGVSWSSPHQGLEAHIERYRNSPVMHSTVPDEYKPVLFENGVRKLFPGPTKPPRVPRIRNQTSWKAAQASGVQWRGGKGLGSH